MKKQKNNRRTKKGAIVALSLAGALAITGAFAFLSDSESAINRFSFADDNGEQTVDVEIIEPSWIEEDAKNILPLDTVAKNPQVVNEGENDVYAFVTVLVPTAKSIVLNNADGTKYTEKNVELFRYILNDGWTEVGTIEGVESSREIPITREDGSVVNKAIVLNATSFNSSTDEEVVTSVTNIDGTAGNIYYTAHTYAYSASNAMTKLTSGNTTSAVFDEVTMINIADGDRTEKRLDEVLTSLKSEDGTVFAEVDGTIVATKDGVSKTIFSTVDGKVVDVNGNIQYKQSSQFTSDDNINIYVSTYAIQADNVTDNVADCWNICANTNAGVGEGETFSSDFYFQIIENDIGDKSAIAPTTTATE